MLLDDGHEHEQQPDGHCPACGLTVLVSDPVEVVDYDPKWPAQFELATAELRRALCHRLVQIEHIGSTAEPGLAAKPVIDIQVGVSSVSDSAEIVAAVTALGYEYVPDLEFDLPNRRYLS